MNNSTIVMIYLMVIAAILIGIVAAILQSPFHYPHFNQDFDVSGKRKPQIDDLIDQYLNAGNFSAIEDHNWRIHAWKMECQEKIQKSILKNYRENQFRSCLDDNAAFRFCITRQQTRYKQVNYVKKAYKVTQTVDTFSCSYEYLEYRNQELAKINHECTLREYNSKEQRKLMTKELRRSIMVRDNYTCQKCGKYMPDEVGLHIDHIVPVSKGGKTVPSNLQVLCSKCNGSKSNKT